MRLEQLATDHLIEAVELARSFTTVLHVERTLELLEDGEGVLHIRATRLGVVVICGRDGLANVVKQKAEADEDKTHFIAIAYCPFQVAKFRA